VLSSAQWPELRLGVWAWLHGSPLPVLMRKAPLVGRQQAELLALRITLCQLLACALRCR
jgi:hypothetical protein